jgi:DNA-binding LacI/PurR family transcriptional regulator
LSAVTTLRPARAPTIGDVARLAGVSHQTVSRVVNDLPGVRPATRGRVLDAVSHLGYRPNAMARALAGRRPRVVGVVCVGTVHYGPAAILRGVQSAARDAGYGVRIVTVEDLGHDALTTALGALAHQPVAGAVVLAPQPALGAVSQRQPPRDLAVIATTATPRGGLPSVAVDQPAGARLAVRHLLELGHRRVWHLSGPVDLSEARGRVEGWRAALADAGVAAPPLLAGDWSARSGYQAGAHVADVIAREGPGAVTAVFAGNDQMALGLVRACYERGVRVPGDVSIVGFDDIPEAGFMSPPLTTVRQDFDAVGRRSVAALLRLVEPASRAGEPAELGAPGEPGAPGELGASGEPGELGERVAPVLVVRRSTGPAPV